MVSDQRAFLESLDLPRSSPKFHPRRGVIIDISFLQGPAIQQEITSL